MRQTADAMSLDKLNDAITAALSGSMRGDAMAKAMAEELRALGAGSTAADVDAGVAARLQAICDIRELLLLQTKSQARAHAFLKVRPILITDGTYGADLCPYM
jgi:hypothetical protein